MYNIYSGTKNAIFACYMTNMGTGDNAIILGKLKFIGGGWFIKKVAVVENLDKEGVRQAVKESNDYGAIIEKDGVLEYFY